VLHLLGRIGSSKEWKKSTLRHEDRRGPAHYCARTFETVCEHKSIGMNETQTEKLREHEAKRDFFGVVQDAFRVFARKSSMVLGSAWAFAAAIFIILIWALTGPTFHFSDTWQLIINTGTTIVTFLMVFLIQNTQNRDAKAMHLKLDEIIRALKGARNQLVDLEKLSDEDLDKLEKQFERLRQKAERDGTHPRHVIPPESH
jgi:low affinity Fe/Cu permease